MKIQSCKENDIVIGRGHVMGGVVLGEMKQAWVLPGGRFTLSKNRARDVARIIDKLVNRGL